MDNRLGRVMAAISHLLICLVVIAFAASTVDSASADSTARNALQQRAHGEGPYVATLLHEQWPQ
jgi:hypothetical protein